MYVGYLVTDLHVSIELMEDIHDIQLVVASVIEEFIQHVDLWKTLLSRVYSRVNLIFYVNRLELVWYSEILVSQLYKCFSKYGVSLVIYSSSRRKEQWGNVDIFSLPYANPLSMQVCQPIEVCHC